MSDAEGETAAVEANAAIPEPIAPVLFKSRGKKKAKKNMRKRSPSPPPRPIDSDSDSDDDSDGGPPDARNGVREVKRRKRMGAGLVSASTGTTTKGNGINSSSNGNDDENLHQTDRNILLAESDVATKRSHMSDDILAGKSKPQQPTKNNDAAAAAADPTKPKTRSVGPVKAPTNIRTITLTDYSPDVCKDYKQTGFCGFGDNCKFLHAREDYKQGWQLDNEWEAVTKGKKHLGSTIVASADKKKGGGGNNDDDDDDDDDDEALLQSIPFACIICRSDYKQPVMTRCGHYFCERCALDRYRRDPTCASCGAATTGVFNNAKRLTKLLERKRARAAARRQAAIEAGEEVSSDDEDE